MGSRIDNHRRVPTGCVGDSQHTHRTHKNKRHRGEKLPGAHPERRHYVPKDGFEPASRGKRGIDLGGATPTAPAATPSAAPSPELRTIRPGDTLWGYASELKARGLGGTHQEVIQQILQLNPKITSPTLIRAGDTIQLPPVASAPTSATPVPNSPSRPTERTLGEVLTKEEQATYVGMRPSEKQAFGNGLQIGSQLKEAGINPRGVPLSDWLSPPGLAVFAQMRPDEKQAFLDGVKAGAR